MPPKRCQICCVDLGHERAYMQQKLLCPQHLKATSVLLNGSLVRFCFQHGKLEPLESFDGLRRTCRAKLRQRRARTSDASDMPLLHADSATSCQWQLQLTAAQFAAAESAAPALLGSCSAPATLMNSLVATPLAAPAMLPHQQLQHHPAMAPYSTVALAPAPVVTQSAAPPAVLRATSLMSQGPSVADDEFEALLSQLLAQEVAHGAAAAEGDGSSAVDDRTSLTCKQPRGIAPPAAASHTLMMRSNSCSSTCLGGAAAAAAAGTPPTLVAQQLPPAERAGSPNSCSGAWPVPAPTTAPALYTTAPPDVYAAAAAVAPPVALGSSAFGAHPPAQMSAGPGCVGPQQAAAKLVHLQQQLQLAHASLAALQTELRALSAA